MFLTLPIFVISNNCTSRKTLFSIDKTNDTAVNGTGTPVYLRMENAGCPYARTSANNWKEAAALYPNVQFVYLECLSNPETCIKYNATGSPYHILLDGNGNVLDKQGNTVKL